MKTLNLSVSLLAQDASAVTNDPADSVRINRPIQEAYSSLTRLAPLQVADETEDQVIALPSDTVEYVLLHTDQTISVKLNGSEDAITLSPVAAGTKTPVMLVRGSITSLKVSNSSGATANLDLVAVNL